MNTTAGEAILLTVYTEEVDRIINKHGLPAATKNVITERKTLLEELVDALRDSANVVKVNLNYS